MLEARPNVDAEHQGQIDLLLQVEKEFSGAAKKGSLLDRLIEFTNEQVLIAPIPACPKKKKRGGAHRAHAQLSKVTLRRRGGGSPQTMCQACAAGCFTTSKPRTPPSPAISAGNPPELGDQRGTFLPWEPLRPGNHPTKDAPTIIG